MGGGEASPLHTVVTERSVGWAKRSVPTIQDNGCGYVVGTLRFAHRTKYESGHTFQKRLFRGLHRVGGSDMHPDAVEPQAEQALLLVGAVEHFRQ